MTNVRVQEYIARSGRCHLSARSFTDLKSALVELKVRAKRTLIELGNDAQVESDYTTHFTVATPRTRRRFTLVTRRGGDPVTFDHLLDPDKVARQRKKDSER